MKFILVSGVVVEERDPLSGIVDIDKEFTNAEDKKTLKYIVDALSTKDKSTFTSNYPEYKDIFETYPFTGTIEDEVTIYWGC